MNTAPTRFVSFVVTLLLLLGLSGCGREPVGMSAKGWRGQTMGTTYEVKWVSAEDSDLELNSLRDEVEAELRAVNEAMSTWLKGSEISRFNRLAIGEDMEISERFQTVLERSIVMQDATGGAFNPAMGPLIDLWGFGASGRRETDPSKAEIDGVLSQVLQANWILDGNTLQRLHPTQLNLSAVAKGYGVDRVAGILEAQGIENLYVEIGGEVRCKGLNVHGAPWRIGVQIPVPHQETGAQRVVSVLNRALATSGDYRNFFETEGGRRHHILDPRTGRPVEHDLASVSVLAPDCMTADAVATALYVMGTPDGMTWVAENPDLQVEALFIDRTETGFRLTATPGFQEVILDAGVMVPPPE